MTLTQLGFRLNRPVVVAYTALAIGLSLALLGQSLRRGPAELALWLVPYVLVGVLSALRPQAGPLVAGLLAFVLGFTRTYRHGFTLDLGLSLITLALGTRLVRRCWWPAAGLRIDLAGLCLLALSLWSALSLGFVLARIRGFAPAPGFGYHVYRFNLLGQSSEEAVVRAIVGGAATFAWFGLYEYARSLELDRRLLRAALTAALLLNGAAAFVQQQLDPWFLHPVGLHLIGRVNGVTSFCYALGDVTLALFLLLPVWGARRGLAGVLTLANVALLGYAALASGSRTALLGMLAATLLWALLLAARLGRERRRAAALACLAAALALGLAGLAGYWRARPDKVTPLGRLKAGVEEQGFLGHLFVTRLSSYPLIARVLAEYPLTGVGVGLYQVEIDKQRALLHPQMEVLDPLLMVSYAPNQLLNTGVELGVPALLALLAAFAAAALAALARWRRGGSPSLAVSLLVLLASLQLGPGLYNSEALVFCWLIVGLAAGRAGEPAEAARAGATRTPDRAAAAVLAGALLVGLTGQWLTRPVLAIESQWRRLRWPMNIGMQPPQADGRWTGSQATFTVAATGRALRVRWHAGAAAAAGYSATVSFFVDGELAERSRALPGRIRESTLPLPAVAGLKRISVEVTPPFVPAEFLGGDDRRRLGVFVHSVTGAPPTEAEAGGSSLRPAAHGL